MTESHLTTCPSSLISHSRLTEAEIDRALAAATAVTAWPVWNPPPLTLKSAVGNYAEKSPETKP